MTAGSCRPGVPTALGSRRRQGSGHAPFPLRLRGAAPRPAPRRAVALTLTVAAQPVEAVSSLSFPRNNQFFHVTLTESSTVPGWPRSVGAEGAARASLPPDGDGEARVTVSGVPCRSRGTCHVRPEAGGHLLPPRGHLSVPRRPLLGRPGPALGAAERTGPARAPLCPPGPPRASATCRMQTAGSSFFSSGENSSRLTQAGRCSEGSPGPETTGRPAGRGGAAPSTCRLPAWQGRSPRVIPACASDLAGGRRVSTPRSFIA